MGCAHGPFGAMRRLRLLMRAYGPSYTWWYARCFTFAKGRAVVDGVVDDSVATVDGVVDPLIVDGVVDPADVSITGGCFQSCWSCFNIRKDGTQLQSS